MSRLARVTALLLALASLAVPVVADEAEGLEWLRQAQAALDANDAATALELVDRATDELPFARSRSFPMLVSGAVRWLAGIREDVETVAADPDALFDLVEPQYAG